MKNVVALIAFVLLLISGGVAKAQRVPVEITLDTTYGIGGKMEVVVGGRNNEVVAFDITHNSRVATLIGKVSTGTTGVYHIGMVRLDSSGAYDARFGNGGIANHFWGDNSDYPNSMITNLDIDSTYIVAGASAAPSSPSLPSIYRFTKFGMPDSTFAGTGRVLMGFDDHSGGEAIHANISRGDYIVCGKSQSSDALGITGFGALRITPAGILNPTFGINGRAVIPALVHSVQGFLLNTAQIFMCGISDTGNRELLIARFTESGVPDPLVGVNGLLHTGIFLTGDTVRAQLSGDNKIVILLPTPSSSPTHLTICRFDPLGKLDTTYGVGGFGTNDILPSYQVKGFFLASDNGEIVSGMTNTEIGHSISTRISDTSARPDPTFNHNGVTEIDVDSGKYANYLKFVNPIGKLDQIGNIKRFIAIGGSIQNGIEHFMIARFIGHPFSGVTDKTNVSEDILEIFPDPASTHFKIVTKSEAIKNIRIVDALGREVLKLGSLDYSADTKTYFANASSIPNGIYYCVAQSGAKQIVQKFVVAH